MSPNDAPLQSPTPIMIEPPVGGFDRPGARKLLTESKLASTVHKVVRAPFGHTVLTLRTLDSLVEAFDVAQQAGQAIHAALMEDLARTGTLAIPEPTSVALIGLALVAAGVSRRRAAVKA